MRGWIRGEPTSRVGLPLSQRMHTSMARLCTDASLHCGSTYNPPHTGSLTTAEARELLLTHLRMMHLHCNVPSAGECNLHGFSCTVHGRAAFWYFGKNGIGCGITSTFLNTFHRASRHAQNHKPWKGTLTYRVSYPRSKQTAREILACCRNTTAHHDLCSAEPAGQAKRTWIFQWRSVFRDAPGTPLTLPCDSPGQGSVRSFGRTVPLRVGVWPHATGAR